MPGRRTRSNPNPNANANKSADTGRRGERLAARALRGAGYRILARNVRTPRGEIDILAVHRGCLVVVEVKTAAVAGRTRPERRLRGRQRRRLEAAGRWLARHHALRHLRLRHDLVAVVLGPGRPEVTIRRSFFGPGPTS